MTTLWEMPAHQALSPIGLPKSQSLRPRLLLQAVNHPLLMRFLEHVDSATIGNVIATLAEEGVRARFGLGQASVTPPVVTHPVAIQDVEPTTPTAPVSDGLAATENGVLAGLRSYDQSTLNSMFMLDEQHEG